MFTSILCHAKTNTFLPLAGTGGHPKVWGFFLHRVCNLHFSSHWKSMCNRKLLPVSYLVWIKQKSQLLSDIGPVRLFLNFTFHFWTKSGITQTKLLAHCIRPCGNDTILPVVANYHKKKTKLMQN